MADIHLTTTASVPADTSLSITVYEDIDDDGSGSNTDPNGKPYDNSATQAIDDGTNTYTLSGFEIKSGNSYWIEVNPDNTDATKTASLDSATLDVPLFSAAATVALASAAEVKNWTASATVALASAAEVKNWTASATSSASSTASTPTISLPNAPVPSTGWYVEVDHPGSGNTLKPMPLSEPQRLPRVNGLPHVRVPVAKADKWHSADLKGATMRVWHDGQRQPIDEVGRVEQTSGQSVIVGVGGVELRTRVQKDVVSEEAYIVGRDLVQNNISYTANFDDPSPGDGSESLQQDADTTSEWNAIVSIADTDPFEVDSGSLKVLQTLFFSEGESRDRAASGVGPSSSGDYSGGSASQLGSVGHWVEFDFNIDHVIPEANVELAVREDNDDGGSGYDIEYQINGNTCDRNQADIVLGWNDHGKGQFTSGGTTYDGGDLRPEDNPHTVRIEADGISTFHDIDCVALYDDRYSYTFDNSVDADGWLSGPQLFPNSAQMPLATRTLPGTINAARIASTWDNTDGNTLEVSNDGGVTYPLSASNTSTLDQSFSSGGQNLKARLSLSRYGTRDTATPTTGFNGQSVDDFELYATVDDSPVLSGWDADDRLVDVLREIADYGNFVFEVRIDNQGNYSVEQCQPGQRTTDLPADALDYSISEDVEQVVERAVVFGAAEPVEGETFTSNHGTEVSLANSPIVRASERVHDGAGTVFERFTDYTPRYQAGTIETNATGTMSDSTNYQVDYRYKISATHTAAGVSSPETRRFDLPNLATERACFQAAKVIVDKAKDPIVEAELAIDKQPLGWNIIDAVNPDVFPTDAHLQIRDVQDAPSRTTVHFASRKSINEIVGDVKAQLTGGSLAGQLGSVSRRS